MNIEFKPVWAIDGNHRKEQHFYKEIVCFSIKNSSRNIICRFYKTKEWNYCCIWISSENEIMANGSAQGHSSSISLNKAMTKCGIKTDIALNEEKENFIELARFIFHEDDFIFHVAHG